MKYIVYCICIAKRFKGTHQAVTLCNNCVGFLTFLSKRWGYKLTGIPSSLLDIGVSANIKSKTEATFWYFSRIQIDRTVLFAFICIGAYRENFFQVWIQMNVRLFECSIIRMVRHRKTFHQHGVTIFKLNGRIIW